MIMSFKQYINESVVDQYLAVRDQTDKAMKVVDDYQKTKKGGILHKLLPRFFRPAVQSSMPGQGVNASREAKTPKIVSFPRGEFGGLYKHRSRSSQSTISKTPYSTSSTIAHELAHSYQHEAQDTKGNIPNPPYAVEKQSKKQKLKQKLQTIKNSIIRGTVGAVTAGGAQAAMGGGFGYTATGAALGAGLGVAGSLVKDKSRKGELTKTSEYWNDNKEVNSRLIGHAVEWLGGRISNDNSGRRIGGYNNHIANYLKTSPEISSTDIISNMRKHAVFRFRYIESNEGAGEVNNIITPKNMKKGMHGFRRILQHHEEQLPADIHTPEGREAFIITHGSREGDEQ